MPRSRSLLTFTSRLETYDELEEYARGFAEGHLNLLLVLGPAGVGKTRALRNCVPDHAGWIDGTATAFGIYMQAFKYRDRALVLDDVDGLYSDRSGVRLLKSLCQTEAVKTVSWHTNAAALDKYDIPRSFTTTSRVAIIANRWDCPNPDVAALLDRGHTISFQPTPVEVHLNAASWFWNQEIFDFVADHLHLMDEHSLRTYVLAWERKQAELDWRQFVLTRTLNGTALTVARMKADPQYQSEKERVRAFVRAGHGCRSTWFGYTARLRCGEDVEVPRRILSSSAPPYIREDRSSPEA